MPKTERSAALFRRAQEVLVGGVNSPVRAFQAVGGAPRFIARAKGPYLWDADGNRFIDFVGSWGPLILGHAYAPVQAEVRKRAALGCTFGAPTELEIEMAEQVRDAFPSIRKIRFVSSGTEAAMTAIRLARGYTRRETIVKFTGCYHGHSDSLLVKAGSGAATLGIPDSLGVPKALAERTISLRYNDPEAVLKCFARFGDQIAAVIVEPVAANMGVVLPRKDFLRALREATARWNAVLIFDEVITGFRLAYGGAQEMLGLGADLTCLGKIVGGGFPVGAVGGKAEIMDQCAPLGGVYQAGTLSGNPVAMAAGLATLRALKKTRPWSALQRRTEKLVGRIQASAQALDLPLRVNHAGSMFTLFFSQAPVVDYDSAKRSDTRLYARFFRGLLERGVYFPPSQFEAAFVSAAHADPVLDRAAAAILAALKAARSDR